jgi:FAD-dependent urate hydroxylase
LSELTVTQTTIRETHSPRREYSNSGLPVVIVGAGPYGLAAAAHLRAEGVETRVFGDPMVFWREHMPAGMLLRSGWEASFISDPKNSYTLDQYNQLTGARLAYPVPLAGFVDYGLWFQGKVVPDLDPRRVARIEPLSSGFRVVLEDGEPLNAARVVVAAGIAPFAWRPPQFGALPCEFVSHCSDHKDLANFSGKRVAVIGGGQSALESAALLHEAGAEVEVIMRARHVTWIRPANFLKRLPKPYRFVFYPPIDVGPLGLNWIVALPDLFRQLPRDLQDRIAHRSIGPMGAHWLRPRVDNVVRITTGTNVVSATAVENRLHLLLDDGTEMEVDHALLGTGYRVDISKYPFLTPELLGAIRRADGYPLLGDGFESSVPGLHFLGAPAAWSFGPVMRFVSGTSYTTRALARKVRGEARGQSK